MTKKKKRPSIKQICKATNLTFCDEDCGCGEASYLFFFDVNGGTRSFVPDWANGADYDAVADWFLEGDRNE